MPDTTPLTKRLSDVDDGALDALFARIDAHFLVHVDELDYRNFDWYVGRANMRFVAGAPIVEVVDDLFLAARCLHKRRDLHLSRLPLERFLSRRVLPVELGIISGQPIVIQELSEDYGLPMMVLLARQASDQLMKEAALLTSYFRRGSCLSVQDLAGLGAVTYAGAIAAIGRGFDDEAAVALNIFADARVAFQAQLAEQDHPLLRRYDDLCLSLACLLRGEYDELGGVLARLAARYQEDLRAKLGDDFSQPQHPQRYFDMAVVTLLAITALRQVALELPDEAPISHYQDFVHAFTTTAPRQLEEPTLSYDDRQLLQQMGMNPDEVEKNLKQQAAEQQQALLTATAAAQESARETADTSVPTAQTDPTDPTGPTAPPEDTP